MPGLPYLRKLSLDDFEISVILSFRVLKYGNISQKSWKQNTRTFSFQASCERREGWLHGGHWPPAPPSHPPRRIQIQTHSQTCNRRPKEGDAAVKGNKTRSSVKLWVNFRNNSTGSSKKNPAKFSDTCSVRAEGLCIGCLKLVGSRKAAISNMQELF